jgi:nicotinamide riboside transporter PnuC
MSNDLAEAGKWSLAVLSLIGVVLNIKRRRECFYIWVFTNAAWTLVDAWHGIWSQATLQLIYFGLAVWGVIEWKATPTPKIHSSDNTSWQKEATQDTIQPVCNHSIQAGG